MRAPVDAQHPCHTRVMTADRRLIVADREIEPQVMADFAKAFHLVQASDGVWVPKCDLEPYEAGTRKPRLIQSMF